MKISFSVEGEPVPKGRPRFNPIRKIAYTPQRTKSYEEKVAWKASAAMRGKDPTTRPVRVEVRIFFQIPKTAKKAEKEAAQAGRLWHCHRCDADNIFKAVSDAINGIVFVDDRQVCEISCSKQYAPSSHVDVVVTELDGQAR